MQSATLRVWADLPGPIINPNIYGHFAEHLGRCIYDGVWSGSTTAKDGAFREDVVGALEGLKIPVLRWPGGCFGDQYHWRDGVGPRAERPTRQNLWWQQSESNAFGTDEFMALCRRLRCEAYFSLNIGSGTPREAREWVEYCNVSAETTLTALRAANGHREPYGVRYWGVGNETWGCGGAFTPEHYAHEYTRYANFVRPVDANIQLIAAGGSDQWLDNKILTEWNHQFCQAMPHAHLIDHLSIHHYFSRGNDTTFTDSEHDALFGDIGVLERAIQRADRVLGYFYPDKFVGLVVDEWGTWHPQAVVENGLQQTNTLRDGVFAGAVLNLFHRYAHRVTMANLAQLVNVLQCVVHTHGNRTLLSPVYHAFRMMTPHQGATLLTHRLESPTFECRPKTLGTKQDRPVIDASASQNADGITVSVVNQTAGQEIDLELQILGADVGNVSATQLHGTNPRQANTCEVPEAIGPRTIEVGVRDGKLTLHTPPCSLTVFRLQ